MQCADFRSIHLMYSAWKKESDPPKRVEPISMSILRRVAEMLSSSQQDEVTMDCIWMAFLFLLLPGGFANSSGDALTVFGLAHDINRRIASL